MVPTPPLAEPVALEARAPRSRINRRAPEPIHIDTINDQFVRNMLTILAELRAALTVFRPAAFATVELAA